MSKFLKMTCIIANNAHIVELTNAIKAMISKQKQQAAAFMKVNMYMTAFKFETVTVAAESSSVYKILMHLTREIVIKCLNVISENHV